MESYTIERAVPERADVRLGRIVNHDSRSRAYPYRRKVTPRRVGLVASILHPRRIPILDQQDVGACTGFAALGALGSDPFYAHLSLAAFQRLTWTAQEALTLYRHATTLDGFPGSYPPDDTGSDGTSVAKACKERNLISGYTHCFTFLDFMAAVQDRPVIVGTNWYESMFEPDHDGVVTIGGEVAGGHEWLVRGWDLPRQCFVADNSFGASWGDQGSFLVPLGTMQRLLREQGDATVFVPLTDAPPAPVPVEPRPVLANDLAALRNGTAQWRASRVGRGAARAKAAVSTYLAQQGAL